MSREFSSHASLLFGNTLSLNCPSCNLVVSREKLSSYSSLLSLESSIRQHSCRCLPCEIPLAEPVTIRVPPSSLQTSARSHEANSQPINSDKLARPPILQISSNGPACSSKPARKLPFGSSRISLNVPGSYGLTGTSNKSLYLDFIQEIPNLRQVSLISEIKLTLETTERDTIVLNRQPLVSHVVMH